MIFQSKLNNFQYDYEDVKNEGFISGTVEELEKRINYRIRSKINRKHKVRRSQGLHELRTT